MSSIKDLQALINSDPWDMLRTKRDLVVECTDNVTYFTAQNQDAIKSQNTTEAAVIKEDDYR